MTRRRISATERMAIWQRCGGICHICGQKISGGKERWEIDHIIPLELGGDDHGENLAPAHEFCHRWKTASDVEQIAKAKRMSQRDLGIKRQPKAVIPGSKASKWKRKLDGTVEPR